MNVGAERTTAQRSKQSFLDDRACALPNDDVNYDEYVFIATAIRGEGAAKLKQATQSQESYCPRLWMHYCKFLYLHV